MWERSELKEKGKASLKANYWKTVLVAIVATFVIGGGAGGASAFSSAASGMAALMGLGPAASTSEQHYELEESTEAEHGHEEGTDSAAGRNDASASAGRDSGIVSSTPVAERQDAGEELGSAQMAAVFLPLVILFCLFMLLVVVAIIALDILVLQPLLVGTSRFFLRNLNQRAEVGECGRGFDRNYAENVKTLFFRELYVFLWSLLLVVPGIVKSYEYRMIPYLLADDPKLTREEAFAQSKALMDGNKWKAFVLDLSFLGWDLLSLATLGILDVFYVAPYRQMTYAALYEALRYGSDSRVLPVASDEAAPVAHDQSSPVAPEGLQG
nr:DUF975 family protein [uncultured Olsenella sp.]